MDTLTDEQIKERIEAAFLPHTAVADIWDYGAKVKFQVQAEDGTILATVPDLPIKEAKNPDTLADVLRQVKEHADKKAKQEN